MVALLGNLPEIRFQIPTLPCLYYSSKQQLNPTATEYNNVMKQLIAEFELPYLPLPRQDHRGIFGRRARRPWGTRCRKKSERKIEEVMDYRTYCETMAGLLQKPIVKLLRNLKVSRNVKWIYQEGISISGRCSLACFNGKLQ